MKNRIVFLIGAGASIPAGIPSTDNITDAVCTTNAPNNSGDKYLPKCISELKQIIYNYYKSNYGIDRKVNYEDIYQLIDQIHMSDLYEYPDPITEPFIETHLEKMYSFILERYEVKSEVIVKRNIEIEQYGKLDIAVYDSSGKNLRFQMDRKNLFRYLAEHIENILINKIAFTNNREKVPNFWNELCEDRDILRCDIFSLNHDYVLERAFFQKQISFNDGFEDAKTEKFRIWNQNLFYSNDAKINLYKLHGSFSWAYHRKYGKVVTEPLGNSSCKGSSISGTSKCALLIGTHNKMLSYSGGIYRDLFFHFRRILLETNYLVICGYGFGDKGVNNYLHDWFEISINKAIIINPDISGLRKNAQPSIATRWDKLKESGNLIEIESGIECMTWNRIKEIIESY
jgi:hypothetical protein